MACMGQTAGLAADARTEASAAVSVDASVPEGGEDSTVRGLVGILTVTVICMFCFTISILFAFFLKYCI